MAALTIEAPDRIVEALDGETLTADTVALENVIRWNVHEVHDRLWQLSESDLDAELLRELAKRLVSLANAIDTKEE